MRGTAFWSPLISLALWGTAAFGQGAPEGIFASRLQPDGSYIVSPQYLAQEFTEDRVSANRKYRWRALEMTGKVIDAPDERSYIDLAITGAMPGGGLFKIQCANYSDGRSAKLADGVRRDQQVQLIGVFPGNYAGNTLAMRSCAILTGHSGAAAAREDVVKDAAASRGD